MGAGAPGRGLEMDEIMVHMPENRELAAGARLALQGRWAGAAGLSFAFAVSFMLLQRIPFVGLLVTLALPAPFAVGFALYYLDISRKKRADWHNLFAGFEQFLVALVADLLRFVAQLAVGALASLPWLLLLLWHALPRGSAMMLDPLSLLLLALIVLTSSLASLVAMLGWSMTMYVLADDNDLGPIAALAVSWNLMRGARWRYCCLTARFLGWWLLALLTCGIGLLWLAPYFFTAKARFYDALRGIDPDRDWLAARPAAGGGMRSPRGPVAAPE